METVTDFTFLGSKITADGNYSHEIRRHSILGRKAMTNLENILKSRDITLPTKICLIKAIVFPVVMYRCESWTTKNAERQCFWTVVLEKTLESPLDSKEIKPVNPNGNQSWIFIIRTDTEAEVPILWPPNAKRQLIRKKPWCWEILKAGGEGDNRRQNGWVGSLTQWTWVWAKWVWANSRRWWRTGKPVVWHSMGSPRVRHDWTTE